MAKLIHQAVYKWYRCSNCMKMFDEQLMTYFNDCQYKPQFNFCPNCGERIERNEDERIPRRTSDH